MSNFNVSEECLRKLYLSDEKPMHEIADIIGISVGSVYNYLKKYNIPTRPQHQGFKGHKHSAEAREKISRKNKGKIVPVESRRRIAASKKVGGIGHKKKRGDGYIYIYFPDHPMSTKDGYVMEHDLVMECLIGRHLRENECVHHIDINKENNTKENLMLMTKSEHMSYHAKLRWEMKKEEMA